MFIAQTMSGPDSDDMPAAPQNAPAMQPDLSSKEAAARSGREMAENIKADMKRTLKRAE